MNRNVNQKLITDRSEKSVEYYLNEISKFQPLTREEEKTLAIKIQQGDIKAMHRLIEANLKYAVTEAKKYQTGEISFSELLQQANLGAIEAAKRFDPSKGTKFITYMKRWNQQAILHYISEYGRELRLPANKVALKNKIRKYKQNHYHKHGENPDVGTIAKELGVYYEKVDFLDNGIKKLVSMNNTLNDETATCVGDTIEDENSLNPIQNLMGESLAIDVSRVISKLSKREREIIKMSFGIGCNEYSIDEVAEHFELTRERIRQIKAKAFKKIHRLIEENNMLQHQ